MSLEILPNRDKKRQRRRQSAADALNSFDDLPGSAFVNQCVVESLLSISPATVWRRVAAGILPQPHRLGPRCTRWRVSELRSILNGV